MIIVVTGPGEGIVNGGGPSRPRSSLNGVFQLSSSESLVGVFVKSLIFLFFKKLHTTRFKREGNDFFFIFKETQKS